jgi:hypothetical protein
MANSGHYFLQLEETLAKADESETGIVCYSLTALLDDSYWFQLSSTELASSIDCIETQGNVSRG